MFFGTDAPNLPIKRDLRKMGWGDMDWIYLALESFCEYVNKLSGIIKCWEILQWLGDWQLLKKDSSAWS
jgi:hypothetical protein